MSQLNTQTRGHHPDSPSSLQSSEACPLFENEQRDGNASKIGTFQHKAAETGHLEALDEQLSELGLSEADIGEKIAGVNRAIKYEKRQERLLFGLFDDKIPVQTIREKYFPVGDDKVAEYIGVTGGFPDTVFLCSSLAVVLDWKFGKVPVTPTKVNLQGTAYALAVLQAYPNIAEVQVHFYHPHQDWSDEEHEEKYVHCFCRADMAEMECRIRTVVAIKHAAQARLKASKGTDWTDATPKHDLCIWCANKGACTKLHGIVIQAASKHPDFIVPEVTNHRLLSRPEQVKTAFLWATQLESIAKSVKQRAANMVLTEGLELGTGVKLVRRTERYITSPVKLARVAAKHGLGLLAFVRSISISVSSLEKQIKARSEKGHGAANVRAFQSELEESGISKKSKPIYFLQEAKAPSEKNKDIIELET